MDETGKQCSMHPKAEKCVGFVKKKLKRKFICKTNCKSKG